MIARTCQSNRPTGLTGGILTREADVSFSLCEGRGLAMPGLAEEIVLNIRRQDSET